MTLETVIIERDVCTPMRDGIVLRCDVYRPAAGPRPVLVIRTPYDKSLVNPRFFDPVKAASQHGYIVVIQDVRGRHGSEGSWYPFIHEADDGYDTVEWAAASLVGSNGQVGLLGLSYLGFSAIAAASLQPPSLRAISTTVTMIRPDNGNMSRGAVFELGLQGGWHSLMGINYLMRPDAPGPGGLRELLARLDEVDKSFGHVPFAEFPLLADTGAAPAFFAAVAEFEAGDGPMTRALRIDTDRLTVPVQCIGGWYDIFLADTVALFRALQARAIPTNLIIGPWTHQVPPMAQRTGDKALPLNAVAVGNDLTRSVGICDEQLAWFDRWLKPPDHAVARPAARWYTIGADRWQEAGTWPPDNGTTAFYLTERMELSPDAPRGDSWAEYLSDPGDPVPVLGGNILLPSTYVPGPVDQRAAEQRSDVLTYTSRPLATEIEVSGAVEVELFIAADQPDFDIIARLCDVDRAGTSVNIVDGIQRHTAAMAADSGPVGDAAKSGHRIAVDLWSTSYVLKQGHRIRLQVTSSAFPRWATRQATPSTVPLHLRVLHGEASPSRLMLPAVGAADHG